VKPRAFVTRPIPAPALDLLGGQCDVQVHPEDTALTSAQLADRCRDVEALLVVSTQVNAEALDQARNLRVVANCGVGYDNIDVAACTRRGIVVTNTPDVLTDATADFAFMLLLAVARRVAEGDRLIREGRWAHWQWGLLWGADVCGRTLGLYGFGRIGQAVARRSRGFAMRIIYHDVQRAPEAVERELGAQYVGRETLLRESDFLSLHVPLTPQTHHLIGAHELSLMKPSAFLINTARGKVVDEEALVAALKSHQIAGAALDVFEREPHVSPALPKLENVVLTPHVASATAATRLKMALLAVENLLAALAGQCPPNAINPEVYR